METVTVSRDEYLRLVGLDATVYIIINFDKEYGDLFTKENIMKMLDEARRKKDA